MNDKRMTITTTGQILISINAEMVNIIRETRKNLTKLLRDNTSQYNKTKKLFFRYEKSHLFLHKYQSFDLPLYTFKSYYNRIYALRLKLIKTLRIPRLRYVDRHSVSQIAKTLRIHYSNIIRFIYSFVKFKRILLLDSLLNIENKLRILPKIKRYLKT